MVLPARLSGLEIAVLTIVFNFGVNDLGNVGKYISKLNELVKGDWSKAGQIIVMSVNPVDEALEAENGYSVTNAQIEEFNQKMKDGLDSNIKFIDVYSQIKDDFTTVDGVHYDNATYQKIYDIIRGSEGSEAGVCDNSSSGNPNVDGYVFPFGVSSGTTTQEARVTDIVVWHCISNTRHDNGWRRFVSYLMDR